MKTLKKLFLLAIFLVTLLVPSSIGLVSCSDEYDDTTLTTDVVDLQTQLTTDVSELQTKLATLESIQNNLPTIAQLNAVAAEASKYADEDEAKAIAEANAADATLLTNINTKIDALESKLNETIDSKVNSENAADATMLTDINTKIDALEKTLNEAIDSKVNSENAADATMLTDINTEIDALEKTLNETIDSKVNSENAADATMLKNINTKIETLEKTLNEAIDSKVNSENAADATMLKNINTKIEALETKLNETINSKVNSDDVDAAITKALDEINIEDIRTLFDGIDHADLVAMKDFVDTWNTTTLPAIIAQITSLGVTVKSMITSIDVVDTNVNYWYWGKVIQDGTFGPNNEVRYLKDQELNELSMGNLIFNINPSNVDISLYDFSIENSTGEELPVINLDRYGVPSEYTGILTKTDNNSNNLWRISPYIDWTEIATVSSYTYTSTPSLYDNYMKSGDDTVRFALTAAIKDVQTGDDQRKITSPYDITFDRTTEQPPLSGLTLKATNVNPGYSFQYVEFSLNDASGNSALVYKKYITVSSTGYSNDDFTELNTLKSLDNSISVYCLNNDIINTPITFTVYYLNFDGTTSSATTTATFYGIYIPPSY